MVISARIGGASCEPVGELEPESEPLQPITLATTTGISSEVQRGENAFGDCGKGVSTVCSIIHTWVFRDNAAPSGFSRAVLPDVIAAHHQSHFSRASFTRAHHSASLWGDADANQSRGLVPAFLLQWSLAQRR